jgi:hypothetical protein
VWRRDEKEMVREVVSVRGESAGCSEGRYRGAEGWGQYCTVP